MWMPLPCYSSDALPKPWASRQLMSQLPSKTEAEKDGAQTFFFKLKLCVTLQARFMRHLGVFREAWLSGLHNTASESV